MAAAATASATTAASSCETGRRGFGAVGGRGEDGELDGVFRAGAFGASDRRVLVHHDALVALVAIIANILVNRHRRSLSKPLCGASRILRRTSCDESLTTCFPFTV